LRIVQSAKQLAEALEECEAVVKAAMCNSQRYNWDKYFRVKITATAFSSCTDENQEDRIPYSLRNEMWGIRSLGTMAKMMGSMHGMDRAKWRMLQSNANKIEGMLKAAKDLAAALMEIGLPENC
jgi:hypothetical protein